MNSLELAMKVLESSRGVVHWSNQYINSDVEDWKSICWGCAHTEVAEMENSYTQLIAEVKPATIHALTKFITEARAKMEEMKMKEMVQS